MEICIAMIPLSWMLGHKASRRANIAAGTLFTLVILFILLGSGKVPSLNFYTLLEVVEIAATAWIVWRAWRWTSPAKEAAEA
jgi:threonine/homoserine/homoserine lactone efflux protein